MGVCDFLAHGGDFWWCRSFFGVRVIFRLLVDFGHLERISMTVCRSRCFFGLCRSTDRLEPNFNTRMDMLDSARQPTPGCLHLGATWTYKKNERDKSTRTRPVHTPLSTNQPTTHRMNHVHHSRRYTTRGRARTGANQSTTHSTHACTSSSDDGRRTRAQPPSKGSLRGSKCTPLCNSQLPACKPIVCRRSQVSKSYIDAEQRRQRSSISILAVRRRARALSSRSDQ